MSKMMGLVLGTFLSLFLLLFWEYTVIVRTIDFDQSCYVYLERAATSGNINFAKASLRIALTYIEKRGMTSGHTSILYKTSGEDVGLWYHNLSKSLSKMSVDINKMDTKTAQSWRTAMLAQLRETILNRDGDVDHPMSISLFPHNTAFMLWGLTSLVSTAVWPTLMLISFFRRQGFYL